MPNTTTLIAATPSMLKYLGNLSVGGASVSITRAQLIEDAVQGPLKAWLRSVQWSSIETAGLNDANGQFEAQVRPRDQVAIGMAFAAASPDVVVFTSPTTVLTDFKFIFTLIFRNTIMQ